jgi:hypothetical protein
VNKLPINQLQLPSEVEVYPGDKVYYHKYPYRVDLGRPGSAYRDQWANIRDQLDLLVDTDYRRTYWGVYYVSNSDDALTLCNIGREHGCNVAITGPVNQSNLEALENHNRETQVIRDKLWWNKYDIRIKTTIFLPEEDEQELRDFITENFDDYKLETWLWSGRRQLERAYISSENLEDVVGMMKLRFYDPTDPKSIVHKFERAVVIKSDK